jgi:hypothetical protein
VLCRPQPRGTVRPGQRVQTIARAAHTFGRRVKRAVQLKVDLAHKARELGPIGIVRRRPHLQPPPPVVAIVQRPL